MYTHEQNSLYLIYLQFDQIIYFQNRPKVLVMSENYFDDEVFFESDQEIKQVNKMSQTHKNPDKMGQNIPNKNKNCSLQKSRGKTNLNYLVTPKSKYVSILRNINQEQGSSNNLSEAIFAHKINNISDPNKDSYENGSNKNLDKKQRNKQAAKNSRDRKKIYIQILEERKKQKQKLLASKKKELQQAKKYYERLVSQNRNMSNFAASRHQLIKRLQLLLEKNQKITQQAMTIEQQAIQKEEINKEINQIIDNLRSRIGATGKQRIRTIDQYFQQIINLSLPALHRYLLWSASENKHLFSANQEQQADHEEWFKELKNALNLTEEQRREIQQKRGFLEEQKLILEQLIEELKSVKDDIEKKSLELDDLIDQIRKILTPIQCAYFIIFIEKNKYRKELNLCSEGSNSGNTFKQGYEHPMRKIVKKEE